MAGTDLGDLRQAVADFTSQAVTDALDRTLAETIDAAPSRSGRLRSEIAVAGPTSSGPLTFGGTIVCTSEYAGYTDAGTAPHVITGNPYLAFYWPKVGRNVVFRSVNHPGTTGTRWFTGGVADGEPMASRWEQALNDAAS